MPGYDASTRRWPTRRPLLAGDRAKSSPPPRDPAHRAPARKRRCRHQITATSPRSQGERRAGQRDLDPSGLPRQGQRRLMRADAGAERENAMSTPCSANRHDAMRATSQAAVRDHDGLSISSGHDTDGLRDRDRQVNTQSLVVRTASMANRAHSLISISASPARGLTPQHRRLIERRCVRPQACLTGLSRDAGVMLLVVLVAR